MISTEQWLYMNELEGTGVVDTRLAKLNAVGRKLKEMPYEVIPGDVFMDVCRAVGLSDITQADVDYIEREWLND